MKKEDLVEIFPPFAAPAGEPANPPEASSGRRTFGAPGSNAWILQCPEASYTNWLELIGSGRGGWCIKKYKNHVQPGDLIYVWVSGKNAGIRALTEIEISPLTEEDLGDIIVDGGWMPGDHWIGLAPLELLDEPVWRTDLKADPRLGNLEILRFAAGSTFRVREDERAVIDEHIARVMGDSPEVSSDFDKTVVRDDSTLDVDQGPVSGDQGSSVEVGDKVHVAEAVAGVVSTRLRIDLPSIRSEPAFTDNEFQEAYLLDYEALGDSDFFIRISDHEVEVGLILDSASMGIRRQKHPIQTFGDQVWDHINLVYRDRDLEELRWGFDGSPSTNRGFTVGSSGGLASWYFSSGQQWVCGRLAVAPGSETPELVDRLAKVLIALDCLSFRDGNRLILTPPDPIPVFVSYSHENFAWVKDDLLPQLKSAAGPSIDFWWDERLSPVVEWTAEIEAQIANCEAALLVVSRASLRPDRFTWSKEVPVLGDRRREDGIPLLGVLVEEIEQEGMAQLEDKNIGLVNADKGQPGQPVFRIGVHKWNTATIQSLLTGSG